MAIPNDPTWLQQLLGVNKASPVTIDPGVLMTLSLWGLLTYAGYRWVKQKTERKSRRT